MTASEQTTGYLEGQLLIAMPAMQDPRFARTVIFICTHNSDGAMGLVVNKLFGSLTFSELLEQVGIEATGVKNQIRVHFGGPVESGRGFVLHSPDYVKEGTLVVESDIALTASVDILKAIAKGQGPRHSFLALGYAGWGAGQLDSEIRANGWLNAPADQSLVFDDDLDTKWKRAMAKLGVDFSKLSSDVGHA
jgi:putative transcriptional regulator